MLSVDIKTTRGLDPGKRYRLVTNTGESVAGIYHGRSNYSKKWIVFEVELDARGGDPGGHRLGLINLKNLTAIYEKETG